MQPGVAPSTVVPVLPELEQAQTYRRETQIDQFRIFFRDDQAAMAQVEARLLG